MKKPKKSHFFLSLLLFYSMWQQHIMYEPLINRPTTAVIVTQTICGKNILKFDVLYRLISIQFYQFIIYFCFFLPLLLSSNDDCKWKEHDEGITERKKCGKITNIVTLNAVKKKIELGEVAATKPSSPSPMLLPLSRDNIARRCKV